MAFRRQLNFQCCVTEQYQAIQLNGDSVRRMVTGNSVHLPLIQKHCMERHRLYCQTLHFGGSLISGNGNLHIFELRQIGC